MIPISLTVETCFDSTGMNPHPWWIPFAWFQPYNEDDSAGAVVRLGVLGFHFCIAAHYYKDGPME